MTPTHRFPLGGDCASQDATPFPQWTALHRTALHRWRLAWLGALALLLWVVAPAQTVEPFDLPEELNDTAGVLNSHQHVSDLQDRLVERTGLQFFIVTVDDFSGQSPQNWLDRTAQLSGLGRDDLALAVSVDTRELVLRAPEGTGLDASAVARAEQRGAELLRDGELDAAVVHIAEAVHSATWRDPGTARERAGIWWLIVVIVVIIGATIGAGLWYRARRRAAHAAATERALTLASSLGPATVALDRALDEGELEVALAEAEFEPTLITNLRALLAQARADALAAHQLRAGVATGPSDDLRLQVKPVRAIADLQQAEQITRQAQRAIEEMIAGLSALRHQADLMPDRLAGLREEVAQRQLPSSVRADIDALFARVDEDISSGRPEAAQLPLNTVVEHLRVHAPR